mmetsp:Transcript_41848/g.91849  ORF Transcript_41848/g.91849 Transcript_41848/m.91849 type:complete len:301 (-) Transcript_41848:845-1747(-)
MASLVFADPMMAGSSSGMAYGEGGTSQADWLKGTMGTSTDSDISSSTCRVGLERIFVMKPGAFIFRPMLGELQCGGVLHLFDNETLARKHESSVTAVVLSMPRYDAKRYEIHLRLGSAPHTITIRVYTQRSFEMWVSQLAILPERTLESLESHELQSTTVTKLVRKLSFGRKSRTTAERDLSSSTTDGTDASSVLDDSHVAESHSGARTRANGADYSEAESAETGSLATVQEGHEAREGGAPSAEAEAVDKSSKASIGSTLVRRLSFNRKKARDSNVRSSAERCSAGPPEPAPAADAKVV